MTRDEYIYWTYFYLQQWISAERAEIVTRWAVVESAEFTSDAFHHTNNPFGLKIKGKLMSFPNIEVACEQYYRKIHSQYNAWKDEDYYLFLERVHPDKSPLFMWKVRNLKLEL